MEITIKQPEWRSRLVPEFNEESGMGVCLIIGAEVDYGFQYNADYINLAARNFLKHGDRIQVERMRYVNVGRDGMPDPSTPPTPPAPKQIEFCPTPEPWLLDKCTPGEYAIYEDDATGNTIAMITEINYQHHRPEVNSSNARLLWKAHAMYRVLKSLVDPNGYSFDGPGTHNLCSLCCAGQLHHDEECPIAIAESIIKQIETNIEPAQESAS